MFNTMYPHSRSANHGGNTLQILTDFQYIFTEAAKKALPLA